MPKTAPLTVLPCLVEKAEDQRLEIRIRGGDHLPFQERLPRPGLRLEEGQDRLGCPDIACQEH